jgi:hypothetical protein
MKTINELKTIWGELGNITVDSYECIEQQFLHFPIGTFREDIWHWMEEQNEEFVVGKAGWAKKGSEYLLQ